jgi:hypothetical protein
MKNETPPVWNHREWVEAINRHTMNSMPAYTTAAIDSLETLASLKEERKVLESKIKAEEKKLAVHALAGDLDDLKDPETERTYRYNETVFIFSPGRITHDFSACPDVKDAEETLKDAKAVNVALGIAPQKLGKPFWTVK